MHIAYNKLLPFIMKYLNVLNSFNDFSRNLFVVGQLPLLKQIKSNKTNNGVNKRIFRKPKNCTEFEHSDFPAFRRFYPNGWNNAKFRAHCAF